jgi:hypothetical protein
VDKPPGEKAIGQLLMPFEFRWRAVLSRDCASAQIDGDAQADCVHDADGPGEVVLGVINVLVQIDQPMFRAPYVRLAANRVDAARRPLVFPRKSTENNQERQSKVGVVFHLIFGCSAGQVLVSQVCFLEVMVLHPDN